VYHGVMRRFRLFTVATTATFLACGGSGDGAPTAAMSASVDHVAMGAPTATVQVGDRLTLTATGIAANGSPVAGGVVWSTASSSIATVEQNGVVTGVAVGLVNITASIGGKTGNTAVTVVEKGVPSGDYTDVTIAPSLWTTCGHTAANGIRCWGMNSSGQLGDGTTLDRSSPVQVSTSLSFAQVESGNGQTCGITPSGDLYCWGNLSFVSGSLDQSPAPRLMSNSLSFADVSIGESSACATALGGVAYCWGGNEFGAVGDGTRVNRTTPVAVVGGFSFEQVVVGGDFACGRLATGAAYCWGRNELGQLGDGETIDQPVPISVAGDLLFTTIAASSTYACGLTKSGAIFCWGNNFGVVQGTGSGGQSTVPVIVNSGQEFTQLSAGLFHACALTAKGAAWCWGANDHGELGNGSTSSVRKTPVAVAGGLAFAKIAAGQWYTCGISTSGAMYCWGYNGLGNLGDGTTTSRLAPTLVK
jgi:alpha-tubulin suppressor-like RCC1 family protein